VQTGNSNSGVENIVSGLTSSTTYLLSAWVKVGVAGEQVAIGVKNHGGTETFSQSTDTAWALNTVAFTTGSTNTTATIYCYKNAGTGPGFCDDFSIVKLTNPASLVANGGFETGSASPCTRRQVIRRCRVIPRGGRGDIRSGDGGVHHGHCQHASDRLLLQGPGIGSGGLR